MIPRSTQKYRTETSERILHVLRRMFEGTVRLAPAAQVSAEYGREICAMRNALNYMADTLARTSNSYRAHSRVLQDEEIERIMPGSRQKYHIDRASETREVVLRIVHKLDRIAPMDSR